jgi:two-component system CheB/CheR fusion protein
VHRPGGAPAGAADGRPAHGFSYGALHLRMLEAYAPPSVVVDERMDVVHLSPGAGRFLHLAGGMPSHNLVDLSRGALRMELRTALYQAFEKGAAVTRRVPAAGNGSAPLRLRVSPLPAEDGAAKFALVVFEEEAARDGEGQDGAAPAGDAARGDALAVLEGELRRTQEQLETTSAARDRIVGELQSANEEFLSVNEEQKAAAEELETSREEIQSINEELTTINQEHQSTIEEQKRTNADLQNLMEATEIATLFLDRALRIRRFTPAAAQLFNFVGTDPGRPLAHITHRLHYPALLDDARRVLDSLERMEREVGSDDGAWYVVRMGPYRALDGGIDGAVLTFFDITARKRAEGELIEARRVAETADRAKGAMLATLSHEFRTPLTAMLMDADLLNLDGDLSAPQGRLVERIRTGGWHLAALIDEILTFARLDEGHEPAVLRRLDAREIAREAGALVESAAEAKDLAFVLDLPGEPVEVRTDGDKARQILANLCGNAVKYTDAGEVRLSVRAEDGRVVFEVRDTGRGIAPEHQALVFDRFWQVDSGTARAQGGMGIGLAAAREFSRLLGGDVELESEAGRGSTFRVWLPRRNEGESRS